MGTAIQATSPRSVVFVNRLMRLWQDFLIGHRKDFDPTSCFVATIPIGLGVEDRRGVVLARFVSFVVFLGISIHGPDSCSIVVVIFNGIYETDASYSR